MAIFSGKIVDAYYTDEAFSNVTVLYNYEKDGQTLTGQYNLVVDENEEQFADLLKEWSYQDIEVATTERFKLLDEQFKDIVKNYVKENHVEDLMHEKMVEFEKAQLKKIFDAIFEYDDTRDKELLLSAKLYLFSLDIIKDSPRDFKTKIRQSKTLLALIDLLIGGKVDEKF